MGRKSVCENCGGCRTSWSPRRIPETGHTSSWTRSPWACAFPSWLWPKVEGRHRHRPSFRSPPCLAVCRHRASRVSACRRSPSSSAARQKGCVPSERRSSADGVEDGRQHRARPAFRGGCGCGGGGHLRREQACRRRLLSPLSRFPPPSRRRRPRRCPSSSSSPRHTPPSRSTPHSCPPSCPSCPLPSLSTPQSLLVLDINVSCRKHWEPGPRGGRGAPKSHPQQRRCRTGGRRSCGESLRRRRAQMRAPRRPTTTSVARARPGATRQEGTASERRSTSSLRAWICFLRASRRRERRGPSASERMLFFRTSPWRWTRSRGSRKKRRRRGPRGLGPSTSPRTSAGWDRRTCWSKG